MEKSSTHEAKNGPILWMQHTGRIHLCKFYAKAATKAQIHFTSLFLKYVPKFQDCKIFTIEVHLKLITKLTVILTSCIKTALSYFHTLEKTAFKPSFSIYHDKIDTRVLILLCAGLRSHP
jgi:hypothetical protein